MGIVSNKKFGTTQIHLVANATYIVVGNNSVSNVATSTENVTGATIRKVIYSAVANSTFGGYWAIHRGANLFATFTGTGVIDFSEKGMVASVDPAANLVFTLNGTTLGSLLVEVNKIQTPANSEYNRT